MIRVLTVTSFFKGNGNKWDTLQDGCSAQIHNAVLDQTKLDLQLLNYLDQNWKSEYHIKSNLPDISFITFYCITELDKTELDIAVHVTYSIGQMIIAIHSPYWMVNKTGRMLQYKADGIHRKHPPDYKKPLLFSFQPKNFLQNNKVLQLVKSYSPILLYVFVLFLVFLLWKLSTLPCSVKIMKLTVLLSKDNLKF